MHYKSLLLLLVTFILGAFSNHYLTKESLNRNDIQQAAKVIGLSFSDSEIDSLLPGVTGFRKDYEGNRKLTIKNSVAPALVFNPLPNNYTPPTEQQPLRYDLPDKVKRPKKDKGLEWMTVGELAYLIKNQQISSLELTQFFLKRIKKYDPQLHFAITITEDLAIKQARRADAEIKAGKYRGVLHGIPYGAKDLLATKQYKTTWGATPFKDQIIKEDATVIQKLEEAGAILIAKTTLGALAWGDVWYGEKTRNPWNPETGSSGSSAGSASMVAAGCVPFAIGTETLGSIVSPSTVCGTTGLRPTFGRVSRTGAMALSWSMDKIGPITRSADDAAMVLTAIEGTDPMDAHTIEAAYNYDATQTVKAMKVGYVKDAFSNAYPFHDQDSIAIQSLGKMGVKLVPIELPNLPDIGFILSAEAAAAFDDLTRSSRDDEMVRQVRNAWPNTFREARFIPAVEYIQANRLRTELIEDMHDLMQEIDAFIAPSWASSSLFITNLTGHPAVVVPNGFDGQGMPTSITFTGQLFDEGTILNLANAFQKATNFDEQHPKGF